MKSFNIYITGVGGQGIGLLSETLLRSADHAGLNVKAVDTHGLAQRGGIVISHLRFGENVFSLDLYKMKNPLDMTLENFPLVNQAQFLQIHPALLCDVTRTGALHQNCPSPQMYLKPLVG